MLYWVLKRVLLGPLLRVLFRPHVEGLAHPHGHGSERLRSAARAHEHRGHHDRRVDRREPSDRLLGMPSSASRLLDKLNNVG